MRAWILTGAVGVAAVASCVHPRPLAVRPTIVVGSTVPEQDYDRAAHAPNWIPPWPCPTRRLSTALVRDIEAYARSNIRTLSRGAERATDDPKVYVETESGTLNVAVPYGVAWYCIFVHDAPSKPVVTLRYFMTAVE